MGLALAVGWAVAIVAIAAVPVVLFCILVLGIESVFPLYAATAAVYVLQAVLIGVGSIVRLALQHFLFRASPIAYITMMRVKHRAKHLCFIALGGVGVAGTVAGITAFVCGVILHGDHYIFIPITSASALIAFFLIFGLYHAPPRRLGQRPAPRHARCPPSVSPDPSHSI